MEGVYNDGINVAGGNDGSGMMPGGRPGQGGPRQDAFSNTGNQDGGSTGTMTSGLYQNGIYTPGEEIARLTLSDVVTTIGNSYRR